MIKKFFITCCVNNKEHGTFTLGLVPVEDPSIVISIPVSEEDATIINFLIDPEKFKESKPNNKILGLYKTMLDGFGSSGTFLSGVIVDYEILENDPENFIYCTLCLCKTENGKLESLMKTNFSNSVILAVMANSDVFLTNRLIDKIVPKDDEETESENKDKEKGTEKKNFPVDKNINKIAKKIMNGKIK